MVRQKWLQRIHEVFIQFVGEKLQLKYGRKKSDYFSVERQFYQQQFIFTLIQLHE